MPPSELTELRAIANRLEVSVRGLEVLLSTHSERIARIEERCEASTAGRAAIAVTGQHHALDIAALRAGATRWHWWALAVLGAVVVFLAGIVAKFALG